MTSLSGTSLGHFSNLPPVRSDNPSNNNNKIIDTAISLARNGLFQKACHTLHSSGIAPITDPTWQLLLSKHPTCLHPTVPLMPFHAVALGPDFNIMTIVQSFSKVTAAGPSGLRI